MIYTKQQKIRFCDWAIDRLQLAAKKNNNPEYNHFHNTICMLFCIFHEEVMCYLTWPIMYDIFPEFEKYKPFRARIGHKWWPMSDYGRKQRIKVLKKLKSEIEKQPNE